MIISLFFDVFTGDEFTYVAKARNIFKLDLSYLASPYEFNSHLPKY